MLRALALSVVLAMGSVSAQVEMQNGTKYFQPHFFFDALNFRSDSAGSRIDLFLQIPYRELQFVKDNSEYLAAYQVCLQMVDNAGNPALQKTWDETAACTSFDETQSNTIVSSTQRHFIIPPGIYTLQLSVTDSETDKAYVANRTFDARDYSYSGVSLSDIMLLRSSLATSGKHTIVPNIEGNVISNWSTFPIFYEIYFPESVDSVLTTTEVFGERSKIAYRYSEWMRKSENTSKVFVGVPKDSLQMGFYRLNVSLRNSADEHGQILASSSRFFSIHFPELPLSVTDLDKASEELMYIATSKEIDSIRSAPDMFTKEKRFIQFWQRYNPNPSSDRNPYMEEYYNRVAYANLHFSTHFPGWKSDMGMVYILLGPPSGVDRHPFELDSKPYEIWYYYQKNRHFTFLDATGFGDYRLLNPTEGGYAPPSGSDFFGN